MLKRLLSFWRMVGSVLSVAADHKTDINEVPALVKGFGDLGKVSSDMEGQFELVIPPDGIAAAREAALEELATDGLEIAGAIHCYATESGDAELAGRVNFSERSLTQGGPARTLTRCRVIAALAAENIEFIADSKITAARLTDFGKKIEAAAKGALKPRGRVVDRSAAFKELKRLHRKGNTILRGRLDKVMVQFRKTQPSLYEKYKAARRIVDPRTTSNGQQTSVAVATTSRGGNGATSGELTTEVAR